VGELLVLPGKADGKGTVEISSELKEWHKVTLTLDGHYAHERDNSPNSFTDINLTVTFTHESGSPSYRIPGYFAADGQAGESSAESGTKWRVHLVPDKAGVWSYTVSFTQGHHAALDGGGTALKPVDGVSCSFMIGKTDKTGRDFRGKSRLQYVGEHHLQFAGSKEYFLKAGAEKNVTIKTWAPHLKDWRAGGPTWKGDKGKGLIGALNYLADTGAKAFSFLTYNTSGDGSNVWPFVGPNDKLHWDCSKLINGAWCSIMAEGEPMERTTPLEIAAELERAGAETITPLDALREAAKNDAELGRNLIDCESLGWLGRYYASKIRGASALALFDAKGDKTEHESAQHYQGDALAHWKQYAAIRAAHYIAALYNRVDYVNVTELIDKVAADVEIARNWKPGTLKDDGKRSGSEKGFSQ
jgi:hypothetical protein